MRDTRVRAISISASFMSSGGSASALSLITSTAVPPRPNTHRPKSRIVREARDQLARLRAAHHRLNRDAGDAGVGLETFGAFEDVERRPAHSRFAREVELDAADVGFVNDVRRRNLD